MAGCQMFRLSCLQHILMWIYWWMRRKFLIKSTVQNETHVSLDEVLNNVTLHAELKFSSSCSFANVSVQHFFGIATLGSRARDVAGNAMSCSWFIPFTLNTAQLLLLIPFLPDLSKLSFSFVQSRALGLHAFEAGWSLTTKPLMVALLSVSPRNRSTEKYEITKIQHPKLEWKQQGQGKTRVSKAKWVVSFSGLCKLMAVLGSTYFSDLLSLNVRGTYCIS